MSETVSLTHEIVSPGDTIGSVPDTAPEPIVQPVPLIEPTTIEPTVEADPDQAFAEHVAKIREKGDSIDAIRAYSSLHGRLWQKAATTAIMGEALVNIPFGIWGAVGSAAVVGAVKFGQGMIARPHAFNKAARRLDSEALALTGERYELYRVKNKQTKSYDVVMRWYGPREGDEAAAEPLTEHMHYIAKLAADNGIKAVMIHPKMLADDRETALKHATETVSLEPWLRHKKGLRVKFRNEDEEYGATVDAYTPQGLTALASEFGRRPKDMADLGAVISTLRSRQPNHPLVQKYDAYGYASADERRDMLQRTARFSLERRLDDVATVFDRQGHQPGRIKQHLSGKLTGEQVVWLPDGQVHTGLALDKKPLLDAVGLTKGQFEAILSDPGKFSDREVVAAMECATYLHTSKFMKLMEQDTTLGVADQSHLLQEKIVENTRKHIRTRTALYPKEAESQTLLSRRARKLARNMLAVAMSATFAYLPTAVNDEANATYNQAYAEAKTELMHELHLQSTKDFTPEEYDQMIDKVEREHPLFRDYFIASNIIGEGVLALDDLIHRRPFVTYPEYRPTFASTSQPASGMSDKAVAVGNVRDSDPVAEWQLEPHGMSDQGYWGTDVGSTYDRTGNWQDVPADTYDFLPTAFDDLAHPQYIRVTHQLGKATPADPMYHLPVLQGTRPAAINFAGREVWLTESRDGSYTVQLGVKGVPYDGNGNNTLEYWLVPDKNAAVPHVTKPTDFTDMDTRQRDVIRGAWNGVLTDPGATGLARAKEEEDYIKQHFTYSLAPLSPRTADNMRTAGLGFDDFTLEVLKGEQANCNVAATLLALDNSELGATWGYNNADEDHQLMSTEAHMWAVDAAGQIFDATPGASAVQRTAANQKHTQNGGDNTPTDIALFGAVLAAAAGGASSRKLAAAYRSARLRSYSTRQLDTAQQVANRAAFAVDADRAKILPMETGLTRAGALQALGKHSLHSEYVQESIDEALASHPNRATRRALKRARAVLSLVRKSGMAETLQAPADISGLI